MKKHNLGEDLQSAYRSAHSTETALLHVKDYIMTSLHKQQGVFLVLLDLSAAFDTVEHSVLMKRMANEIGLTGTELKWFISYLTGRMTRVCIDGVFSESCIMNYGLAQGSIVGPGSCKIYTIPIGCIIRKHNISYMYADDIQLSLNSNPTKHDSIQCALFNVLYLHHWNQNVDAVTNNMLKLNDSKTEFFIATSSFSKSKMPPVCLEIGTELNEPSDNLRRTTLLLTNATTPNSCITVLCVNSSISTRHIHAKSSLLSLGLQGRVCPQKTWCPG